MTVASTKFGQSINFLILIIVSEFGFQPHHRPTQSQLTANLSSWITWASRLVTPVYQILVLINNAIIGQPAKDNSGGPKYSQDTAHKFRISCNSSLFSCWPIICTNQINHLAMVVPSEPGR